MAEETTRKVLLDIQIKNSDAVKRAAELDTAISQITDEMSKLRKEEKAGIITREQLSESLIKLKAEQKLYKDELRVLNKEIESGIKIQNSAAGSNEQLRAELSLLTIQYNKLSEEERDHTARGQALQAQIKGLSDTLKENESAVGDNRRNVGNYTESILKAIDILKAENDALQENKKQLELQRNGLDPNSAAYKELGHRIEEVTNKQNLNAEGINQANNNLVKLSNTTTGAAAGNVQYGQTIEGMKSRISELGEIIKTTPVGTEEFKEATEEARRLQFEMDKAIGKVDEFGNKEPKNPAKEQMEDTFEAANALTSSIGLLTVAFGESENIQQLQARALKVVAIAQTAANIAKAKGAILGTAEIIRDKAAAAAKYLYAGAVKVATAATKSFSAALKTTGILALVAAVGALLISMRRTKDASKELTAEQIRLRDVRDEALKQGTAEQVQAVKLFSMLKQTTAGTKERKDAIAEINKQYGTTLKNLKDEAAFLREVDAIQRQVIEGIQLKIRARLKEEEAIAAIEKLVEQETLLGEENLKIVEERLKRKDEEIEQTDAFADAVKRLANEQVNVNDLQDKNAFQLQTEKEIQEGLSKTREEQIQNYLKQKEAVDRLTQELVNLNQQIPGPKNDKTRQSVNDRINLERGLLDAIRKAEIDAIEDAEQREIKMAEFEASIQRRTLNEQLLNFKGTEEEKQILAELTAVRIEQINEKLGQDLLNIEVKFADERRMQRNSEYAKTFSAQSEALKDQYMLELQFSEASIKDTEKLNRAKLESTIGYYQAQIDLIKKFGEESGMFTQEQLDQIAYFSQLIDGLKTKLEENPITIFTEQELQNLQTAGQFIQSILDTVSQATNAYYENKIAMVDQATQAEIAAINKSSLTEQQKQEKIKALEEKAALDKWKLQVEQFEINKGLQMANAAVAAALAVINALATQPFIPVGVAAAISAGIAGAAQIAIIAGQQPPPKPQFFSGGFTESGNPRAVSRYSNDQYDLHKGEYVAPNKVLKNPEAWPHIQALERFRLGTPGALNLPGFADGGFTARATSNTELSKQIAFELAKILPMLPPPRVAVDDISRAQVRKSQSVKVREI